MARPDKMLTFRVRVVIIEIGSGLRLGLGLGLGLGLELVLPAVEGWRQSLESEPIAA